MEFLLAWQFLTVAPIKIRGSVAAKNLARSMAYFPAVGVSLGLLAAAIHAGMLYVVTRPVADLIAIAFLVMITGNLHGDGLMDTADGLFSGRPREGMLAIMKDSRVGSHGVVAGCLLLLTKYVLLGQMPTAALTTALILMPAAGRWAQVYGAAVYPYARPGGGTGSFTALTGAREVLGASLTLTAAVILLLGLPIWGPQGRPVSDILAKSIILLGGILAGTAILGRYIAKRIGGMTGDTLGAMNECVEVLALLLLLLISA